MFLDLQRPQTGLPWSQRSLDLRQGSHDCSVPFRRSAADWALESAISITCQGSGAKDRHEGDGKENSWVA